MTEAFITERGIIVVPGVRHTCDNPPSTKMCPACAEMVAFWESFEGEQVTPITPEPIDFDTARDLAFEAEGFDDFLCRMEAS